jgi:hypothetical protein
MSERTVQPVVIAGKRDATTVELPWRSQQALLRRLAGRSDTRAIAEAIKSADTQRPVALSWADAHCLLEVCSDWLAESNGSMPDGIYALRNALLADLL